jgi:hypothetical protein
MGALPHKFPRTPHLAGSRCTRDDRVLSPRETARALAAPLSGDEKIDGANVGVGFDPDTGALQVQNRGHVLGRGEHAQYAPLWPFLRERQDALLDTLGGALILFGEWCYARHSVRYTLLPSYFVAFDLYDKRTGEFADRAALEAVAARVDVALVPRLFTDEVLCSLDEVRRRIATSRFGTETAEGIYLRAEVSGRVTARYKFVRDDFIAGITEHWASRPIEPNRLRPAPATAVP